MHDLPSEILLKRQAERLAPMRSRLLRRLGIAHLGPVLDLGCGYGSVVPELVRRSRGPVYALDRNKEVFSGNKVFEGALPVVADAEMLPFEPDSFSLVFTQLFFLWAKNRAKVLKEIRRILKPEGFILCIEPDFGGLLEWPEEIALKKIWIDTLKRAGADPMTGRKLAPELEEQGFTDIRVDLMPSVSGPDTDRFDLLEELPMTEKEKSMVLTAKKTDSTMKTEQKFVYLPYMFITARRG